MVLDLVVDPTDPETVYAAFAAVSGRASTAVRRGPRSNAGLTIQVVQALAIDPTSPSTLYAGTQDGIFKSTDAGATWTSTSSGLKGFFKELAIGPAGNALYVGTHGSGLFRSLDGAASWGAAGTGQIDNFVSEIAVDPNAPGSRLRLRRAGDLEERRLRRDLGAGRPVAAQPHREHRDRPSDTWARLRGRRQGPRRLSRCRRPLLQHDRRRDVAAARRRHRVSGGQRARRRALRERCSTRRPATGSTTSS